jgi:DNA-binding GntR family transcriptional regulator
VGIVPGAGAGTQLALTLYHRLRNQLLSGKLRQGELISERALVQEFGASRTPIRHALARLEEQRLVIAQPRRGYVVSTLNASDIAEILYMRTLLEGAAAALAARRIRDEELGQLERLANASYIMGDPASHARFVRANRDFHLGIARASGNTRLVRAISALLDEMRRVITSTVASSYRIAAMQQDHRAIVRALRRGDPAAAKHAVVRAMAQSRQRIADALFVGDGRR